MPGLSHGPLSGIAAVADGCIVVAGVLLLNLCGMAFAALAGVPELDSFWALLALGLHVMGPPGLLLLRSSLLARRWWAYWASLALPAAPLLSTAVLLAATVRGDVQPAAVIFSLGVSLLALCAASAILREARWFK